MNMDAHTIAGEVDGKYWRATYAMQPKFVSTGIMLEARPARWVTVPNIAIGSFDTLEELRAAIELQILDLIAGH